MNHQKINFLSNNEDELEFLSIREIFSSELKLFLENSSFCKSNYAKILNTSGKA